MRLTIVKIGRVAYPEIKRLQAMYQERLTAFTKVESVEVKNDAQALKLLRRPAAEHPLILLDETGQAPTSAQFAATLAQLTDDPGVKTATFMIGGPMGLGEALRREARQTLSLSAATLTSDLAWLLLWEQIYRAYNILKGTGYHHEGKVGGKPSASALT